MLSKSNKYLVIAKYRLVILFILSYLMSASPKSDIELFVINKVKELRERQNMSQSELAVRLDVSNGFIGQAESSKHPSKYNLNHLNKLAIIFDCSIKDFVPSTPFK